ncbi:hypothetical protein CUR178_03656 [Leishmania enriettii]|uniref:Phosphoenolpyruvate carboxykinase n=1 Tax=Leishmania enriettii TaxID=5663 RepID=A0A836KIX2_LEIEN|nr:hypothetical protein CUR178_03656 [Leishmania enriettii]
MPPVARLTPEQAMFWFIMGYTANVPGVEAGSLPVAKPIFSSCFGGPFLVRHATFYGEQLARKMTEHKARVWLLNTGYAGGRADRGAKRMPLKVTRAVIDAIHDGSLDQEEYCVYPGWGLQIPKSCSRVPPQLLDPRKAWKDVKAFNETTKELVTMFQDSFQKRFAAKASDALKSAVPKYVETCHL